MRIQHTLAVSMVVAGLTGVAASAQSLGELAAKERQKRQGKPAPKVITEDDLSRAGTRGTLSVTGETAAEGTVGADDAAAAAAQGADTAAAEGGQPAAGPEGAKPGAKKEKTQEEIEAERRAAWQKKLDFARQKAGIHKTNVDTLQLELNDLSGGIFTDRRTQLVKKFDEEKAKLAAAQAELETLDDEGRRNGWPR